jgi:hypothetical protein
MAGAFYAVDACVPSRRQNTIGAQRAARAGDPGVGGGREHEWVKVIRNANPSFVLGSEPADDVVNNNELTLRPTPSLAVTDRA